MKKLYVGAALMALVTLMTELILTRVFDVIITTNMSYLVITCAMFAFGLSGVYITLRKIPESWDIRNFLSLITALFAVFIIAILPAMNILPFDHKDIPKEPFTQVFYFGLVYLSLATPFFFAGMFFAVLFSTYSDRIQTLYFWDLSGAAVGSVIFIPFLPMVGASGLLFCASGIALLTSALLTLRRGWAIAGSALGVIVIAIPFVYTSVYTSPFYEFRQHTEFWLQAAKDSGDLEFTRWDPISKIEVINWDGKKRIAYDGGKQLSFIFEFDGDYETLRANVADVFQTQFWTWGTLAAHYLKRDTDQRVLIIGGGGGQETKAALMYGAAQVDVVELVPTVVEIASNDYSDYSGGVYNHPKVNVRIDEGRNALRHTDTRYDIIQIFSNHTSSAIAAGTGAMAPTYLQTKEAYQDYFDHLSDNGILQINQYLYPRMITTAALAWKAMGRSDFQRHVAVFARKNQRQPTSLFKMQPWTPEELADAKAFFEMQIVRGLEFEQYEDPVNPANSFLSADFYSGDPEKIEALQKIVPYRITPMTDDRPYFRFWRNTFTTLEPDRATFVDSATAIMLNRQMLGGRIPMDVIHLIVTGIVSTFFVVVFILLPLFFSEMGKLRLSQNLTYMAYFSCLGGGFIIFELVFIQVFMHFVGSPLYTYSTVIFTMLLAAGLGSMCSGLMGAERGNRWIWPFIGIFVTCSILLGIHREVFDIFLGSPIAVRVLVSGLLIFPLGFFLGMPFPLGILQLQGLPKAAVAWAWGMNGLFTVVGGLSSVMLSIFLGFQTTLLIALGFYVAAFVMFALMRKYLKPTANSEPASGSRRSAIEASAGS